MVSFRVLSRNILSNWMAYVVQVAITFFLTPFVLHQIGDARYGVWTIVISITGYYGVLDLGLRAGMTQYITRYFSKGDFERMNRAASSGFTLHLGCAACALVVTLATAVVAPLCFSFPPEVQAESVWCVLILGCSTAIQLLLFPFSVALTARQRFDLITAASLFSRIVSATATVLLLLSGYGLIGVCAAGAAGNLLDYALRWAIGRRVLPELAISLRLASWDSCRECMTFGFWSALLAVSHLVISFSDALVIGLFMPVSAIAYFALANNLMKYFANIFVPVSQVFYPAATDLDAHDDLRGLQAMYLKGTRMLSLVAISAALITGLWASDFYRLWVGDRYVHTDSYHSVALLFQILLVGALFTAGTGIGSKILLGRRRFKGLTWLMLVEGALNLLISVALIRPLGLLGVAIGTTLPAVLCRGIAHPIIVCGNLQLRFKDYSRQILWPAVIVAGVLTPMVAAVHHVTAKSNWTEMVFGGILATAIAAVMIGGFGLNTSDRQRYLFPTLRRIARIRGVLEAKP
ncbi:lipopolysaccharide biosynthesis protein [Stieleria maiorica]|nr:oligosaccharide flippase family protein [Stieleria maiorica]